MEKINFLRGLMSQPI